MLAINQAGIIGILPKRQTGSFSREPGVNIIAVASDRKGSYKLEGNEVCYKWN